MAAIDALARFGDGEDDGEGALAEPEPARLEADERRRAQEEREDREDEYDPDAICQLCFCADHGSGGMMDEIRELMADQAEHVPEREMREQVARRFNETCYKNDLFLRTPKGVRKITKSDVRHHLRHVRHLQDGESAAIDEEILYVAESMGQVKADHLWRQSADGALRLQPDGLKAYKELAGMYRDFVLLRHRCRALRHHGRKTSARSYRNGNVERALFPEVR